MAKPKKVKQKSYSRLKRELDQFFSRWLRSSGADAQGYSTCYTCGLRDSWQALQCGHFIPRQYLQTRWLSDNCKIQCVQCNIFKKGAYPEFALKLGHDMVAHLVSLKYKPLKLTRADLQAMIEEYTARISALST